MGIRINRVYTRSGDKGDTSLAGSQRVKKNDLRVCAYGAIDELNTLIGFTRESLDANFSEVTALLEDLQHRFFDLGAEIATPLLADVRNPLKAKDIEEIEKFCDYYAKDLPELKSFVLPGGSEQSSRMHLVRVSARRAERELVDLMQTEEINPEALRFLNRVSDLFFILSRWILRRQNLTETLWIPKQNKQG